MQRATGGMMDQQIQPVRISEAAAKRVAALIEKQGDPELKLRVSVSGGGCSGFQYGFDFAREPEEGDHVVNQNGVTVLIDDMSLMYLIGSEIDFVEDLIGASFQINNPNAQSSCGCGTSFAI